MAAYQYIYVMKGLNKTYAGGREVLKDIWLSFLPGAKIGVLGANGAGKSTLLRIMAGDEITVADRIRARRNQAYATRLALQAVEALNASTGGAGLQLSNPIQRAWRDVNAVARHVSLNWDAVGTMYGQHAFGLDPRGQY